MPTLTSAALSAKPHDFNLRRQLRQRLLALPYRAFLQVVIHMLSRQGCSAVRPAGRTQWKGRNRGGGWDAEADFSAGAFGTLRCLVQVKQFAALAVHQRQVDELRGSCLRAGAQQALLVTLSRFSPVAQRAAATPIVPMRLMDGEALLDSLIEQGLGVIEGTDGKRRLDDLYFLLLEKRFDSRRFGRHAAKSQEDAARQSVPRSGAAPSVTVIVRLAADRRGTRKQDIS